MNSDAIQWQMRALHHLDVLLVVHSEIRWSCVRHFHNLPSGQIKALERVCHETPRHVVQF